MWTLFVSTKKLPQEEEREELSQRAMAQYAKVGDPWVSGFRNRQLTLVEFYRETGPAIPGPQVGTFESMIFRIFQGGIC